MLAFAVRLNFDYVEQAGASLGAKVDLVIDHLPDVAVASFEVLAPVFFFV